MKISPARVKELASTHDGRRRLDAMVARVLGWRTTLNEDGLTFWLRGPQPAPELSIPGPPLYVSGNDWRRWGEMWEALPRPAGQTRSWILRDDWTDDRVQTCRAYGIVGEAYDFGEEPVCCRWQRAATLPLALALAMAATGMLEEAEDVT